MTCYSCKHCKPCLPPNEYHSCYTYGPDGGWVRYINKMNATEWPKSCGKYEEKEGER